LREKKEKSLTFFCYNIIFIVLKIIEFELELRVIILFSIEDVGRRMIIIANYSQLL
jgi:hypothetical protein